MRSAQFVTALLARLSDADVICAALSAATPVVQLHLIIKGLHGAAAEERSGDGLLSLMEIKGMEAQITRSLQESRLQESHLHATLKQMGSAALAALQQCQIASSQHVTIDTYVDPQLRDAYL